MNTPTTPKPDESGATSCSAWRIVRTDTAWNSIGHDGGTFRIRGGRALYDAVIYNCATARTNNVTLARLGNYDGTVAKGLRQYNRIVDPDTVLEFLEPNTKTEGPPSQDSTEAKD